MVYECIKPAVEAIGNAEELFDTSSDKGKKNIKVCSGFVTADKVLMPVAFQFKKSQKNVTITIETYSMKEMYSKLKSGDADLIFYGGNSIDDDDSFIQKECFSIKNSFIISSKIKNDFPSEICLKDINKYPLIMKDKNSGTRKYLDEFFAQRGIELHPKIEVDKYWSIIYYIKSNMGMGFINKDFVKDEIESGEFVEIPIKDNIPEIPVRCAYLKNNKNKAIIKEYIQAVIDKMKPTFF